MSAMVVPLPARPQPGSRATAAAIARAPCCCHSQHLTSRQVDVLCLLAGGASTDQAGQALHMSSHTIAHHLRDMLRRSGAANRTELVAMAYASGVLDPGHWPPRSSGRRCIQLPAQLQAGVSPCS
jgi:DNA-binding NarL/FixJ family response regulator